MEGQINIKMSLDTRGLHRDYGGETLAHPGRERGPLSIEGRWEGSWGSSRDSNLSSVDRNLHGRVYGIGKILSVPWGPGASRSNGRGDLSRREKIDLALFWFLTSKIGRLTMREWVSIGKIVGFAFPRGNRERTTVLRRGDAPAENTRHTSGRAPRRRLLLS